MEIKNIEIWEEIISEYFSILKNENTEFKILAGEITNSNTDTLLHNLMKDDKEL